MSYDGPEGFNLAFGAISCRGGALMGKADDTKDRIKAALVSAMSSIDVASMSVADVAERAGVSRSTVYRYYDSVNGIVKELENECVEAIRDIHRYTISSPLNKRKIGDPLGSYVELSRYLREHEDFYLAITGEHGDPQFIFKIHKIMREFYGGKLAYERLGGREDDLYMTFAFGGHDAVVDHWLRYRPDIPPEEFSAHLQKLMYAMFLV